MEKLNKIVFIDDDVHANDYHEFLSKKADVAYETIFFTSGESALSYLSGISSKYDFPDLIFIDINMPGMDGHAFAAEVQELPQFNEDRTELAYLTGTLKSEDPFLHDEDSVIKHYFSKTIGDFDIGRIVAEIFNKNKLSGK